MPLNSVNSYLIAQIHAKDELVIDEKLIANAAAHFVLPRKQVEDFIVIVFTLIKAAKSLEGILICRNVLGILLDEMLTTSTLSTSDKLYATTVLDYYFNLLVEAPKERLYRAVPTVEKSPFFSYYVEVAAMIDKEPTSIKFFRSICLIFSDAIRRKSGEKLENDTNISYGRAFRYFIKYKPDTDGFAKSYIVANLEDLILEAIWNYDKAKNGNESDELNDTADRYAEMLKNVLLAKKRSRAHPRSPSDNWDNEEGYNIIEKPTLELADGEAKILDKKDNWMPEKFVMVGAGTPRSSLVLGGMPDEEPEDDDEVVSGDFYYPPDVDPTDKTVPTPPHLKRNVEDRLHMEYYDSPFDSKYPSLYHHSIVLRSIQDDWTKTTIKRKAIMLHILLMTHTGIAPSQLFRMRFITGALDDKCLKEFPVMLKKTGGIYYIFKPAPVSYKTEHPSGETFLPTIKIVRFPLSCEIAWYIDNSGLNTKMDGLFFSSKNPYTSTNIRLDDVSHFLDPLNKKHGFNLTPSNISRSFFSMYHARYGLDAIKACYIAGKHYRQLSAQLHYVYLRSDELENEYRQISAIVESNIKRNISQLIALKKMPPYEQTSSIPSPDVNNGDLAENPTCGYGTPFVALTGKLISYVGALKEKITTLGWDEMIERHNLFMIYAYLCMQFSFAHRPRNQVSFEFDNFLEHNYVVINDKQSSLYREERILPATNTLLKIVKDVRNDFNRVRRHIAVKKPAILQLRPQFFFFFISANGNQKEFSLEQLRSFLTDAALSYPFNMKTPRHYVRTYLYKNGFCNDLADAFVGHHHVTKEPIGTSSSLIYEEFVSHITPAINNMLGKIGLTPIPYMPDGK